jgi:two-component system, OmpR family, osmolarity sensor histidine kinase EnvZ
MTKTLFGRTSIIISVTMLAFLLASITIAGYFIILPVGKRNADYLSALILLSAQTFVKLPQETRQNYINELSETHQLFAGTGNELLVEHTYLKPYFIYMEEFLSKHPGTTVNIAPQVDNPGRHWVDLIIANEKVRIGFDQQRMGVTMPYVGLYLISILAIMAIISSLALVRKITKPVQKLSQAAAIIGAGGIPSHLIEEGPIELAETAKAFNKMSTDVQNLLENRTVLLSGISHDLRTPLTRMGMALEMLPDNVDDELRHELINSISNMELIIKEYMLLTKGLKDADIENTNINSLIINIVDGINPPKHQKIHIVGPKESSINTHVIALHRVLFNLIENAIRYGNSKPINITWTWLDKTLEIEIIDQGLGIPEQHREEIFSPFFRIESSRNRESGGTGLGLAIVDQIITQRGWKIDIASNMSSGTKITLSIQI